MSAVRLLAFVALCGCTGQSCPVLDTACVGDTAFDTGGSHAGTRANIFYAGEAQTSGGQFLSGHFGFDFANAQGASVCTVLSEWSDAGRPPPVCPDCEWAFTLSLGNGVANGAECTALAANGSHWDGFTASWGFAPTFDYDNGGTVFHLDTVLLYYSKTYGWVPLAYNYGGYGYNTGDASDVAFRRYYSYQYFY